MTLEKFILNPLWFFSNFRLWKKTFEIEATVVFDQALKYVVDVF